MHPVRTLNLRRLFLYLWVVALPSAALHGAAAIVYRDPRLGGVMVGILCVGALAYGSWRLLLRERVQAAVLLLGFGIQGVFLALAPVQPYFSSGMSIALWLSVVLSLPYLSGKRLFAVCASCWAVRMWIGVFEELARRPRPLHLQGLALLNIALTSFLILYLLSRYAEYFNQALRLRDKFLSIASHELRTPVAVITYRLKAALRAACRKIPCGREGPDRVEEAFRHCKRLGALVETLFDVSRLSAGHFHLKKEACDLARVANEVVEQCNEDVKTGQAHVEVSLPAGPVVGEWDPLRVGQLLANLLNNSLRHAPGRPVGLKLEESGDEVRLEVWDEGPGIPPAQVPHLFYPFSKAFTQVPGGLGLGLYVSREIVKAHGGRIEIKSEVGRGTRVLVDLPRGNPTAQLPPDPP